MAFVGSRVRFPLYQPRLPIGGGGGVFQAGGAIPYKPSAGASAVGGLAQIFSSLLAGKQQSKRQQLEDQLRRAQIIKALQPKSMYGKAPWHQDPRYRGTEAGKIGAGILPRAGRETERTEEDILKEIGAIYKNTFPEGSIERQFQDSRLAELKKELSELRGMAIEEVPGTPGKESWLPFGWGDVPEVPATERLVPKVPSPTATPDMTAAEDILKDVMAKKKQPKKVTPGLESIAKKKYESETKKPFGKSAQAQSAPIVEFNSVWPSLSVEQKKLIWTAWQQAKKQGVTPKQFYDAWEKL
jgi:hypothetical protein